MASTSCIFCKEEQKFFIQDHDEISKKLNFIFRKSNTLPEAAKICLGCAGRVQQLQNFSKNFMQKTHKIQKSTSSKSSEAVCYFCSSPEIIKEQINIQNILKNTKIIKDLNIDIWSCYSCYNLIELYIQYQDILNTVQEQEKNRSAMKSPMRSPVQRAVVKTEKASPAQKPTKSPAANKRRSEKVEKAAPMIVIPAQTPTKPDFQLKECYVRLERLNERETPEYDYTYLKFKYKKSPLVKPRDASRKRAYGDALAIPDNPVVPERPKTPASVKRKRLGTGPQKPARIPNKKLVQLGQEALEDPTVLETCKPDEIFAKSISETVKSKKKVELVKSALQIPKNAGNFQKSAGKSPGISARKSRSEIFQLAKEEPGVRSRRSLNLPKNVESLQEVSKVVGKTAGKLGNALKTRGKVEKTSEKAGKTPGKVGKTENSLDNSGKPGKIALRPSQILEAPPETPPIQRKPGKSRKTPVKIPEKTQVPPKTPGKSPKTPSKFLNTPEVPPILEEIPKRVRKTPARYDGYVSSQTVGELEEKRPESPVKNKKGGRQELEISEEAENSEMILPDDIYEEPFQSDPGNESPGPSNRIFLGQQAGSEGEGIFPDSGILSPQKKFRGRPVQGFERERPSTVPGSIGKNKKRNGSFGAKIGSLGGGVNDEDSSVDFPGFSTESLEGATYPALTGGRSPRKKVESILPELNLEDSVNSDGTEEIGSPIGKRARPKRGKESATEQIVTEIEEATGKSLKKAGRVSEVALKSLEIQQTPGKRGKELKVPAKTQKRRGKMQEPEESLEVPEKSPEVPENQLEVKKPARKRGKTQTTTRKSQERKKTPAKPQEPRNSGPDILEELVKTLDISEYAEYASLSPKRSRESIKEAEVPQSEKRDRARRGVRAENLELPEESPDNPENLEVPEKLNENQEVSQKKQRKSRKRAPDAPKIPAGEEEMEVPMKRFKKLEVSADDVEDIMMLDPQDPLALEPTKKSPKKSRKFEELPEILIPDEETIHIPDSPQSSPQEPAKTKLRVKQSAKTVEPVEQVPESHTVPKPDAFYLEKFQIQPCFINLEQVSVEEANLELKKRARKQKHPKKHDASSFSSQLSNTSTNAQVQEAYGSRKPKLLFKVNNKGLIPIKHMKKAKVKKPAEQLDEKTIKEFMPLPRVQVKQEIQNSVDTNKQSSTEELVNGDKVDDGEADYLVDGDSCQEEGSMADYTSNSAESPVAFDYASTPKPCRSILKKPSTESSKKKKKCSEVSFSDSVEVFEAEMVVNPEPMCPEMAPDFEERVRVEVLEELGVEDVEREMQAIHLECEPEEEEEEMIEEHLHQNGEDEEFIDNELSNEYVEQPEETPGFPATLDLGIEYKEDDFMPPKRIPMPIIPVTPDLTAGPLLIPSMTDHETMSAIQTITLTVNNAVELNSGPIEFNLESIEQPLEYSEE